MFSLKPIQNINLFKENQVNKEDLSRYESMIVTEVERPSFSNKTSNESEQKLEYVNSSTTSSSAVEAAADTQKGCFVKINLNARSLIKSAPKRGAPTKAQRKRKLKENETKQTKKAKLDNVLVDQEQNNESNTCKLCQTLVLDNSLVCSTCNFSFHWSCIKGYIPLKKSRSCISCKKI